MASLSPINRHLLSNNIEGQRVYIPETVTVAYSSSTQISRNQFLVPVPDPICSTRILPEVSHKSILQSKSDSVHYHEVCDVEPMDIEISKTGSEESHQAQLLPSENQRIIINSDTTVPMEEHSVPNERQHYGNVSSISLPLVTHDSHHESVQLYNYEDDLINALDLGLIPINDVKESRLNKSMDVSKSFTCAQI